jgi:uncharacterized protein YraI
MKLKRNILAPVVVGMLLFAILFALPFPTYAQQVGSGLVGRVIFNVNVRTTPGTSGAVIGNLQPGVDIPVLGRTTDNNWVQVSLNGTQGWAAAWLMVFNADTLILDVTTDLQPAPAGDGGPFGALSPYNVNVRAAPDANAALVRVLAFGVETEATGRNATNNWVRLRLPDGTEGWAAAWLMILRNDITALPEGESLGVIPPTPRPTTLPGTPTVTPTPRSNSTPPPATGFTVSSPHRINVRTEPSVNGSILDILPFSTPFAAVGRNASNNWIQIDTGSTRGWVAAWVVVASANTIDLPVTSDSTEVNPFPGTITARGVANVNIRNSPTNAAATNGVLPGGTSVPLLARTTTSDWVRVEYNGISGWMASWVIVATADINNLPVE